MKKSNGFIKLEDGSIRSDYYTFPKSKKSIFGIIKVWPELLHPEIKDEELEEKEKYTLGIISLNKGQIQFEIYTNSREEVHEVFLYLLQRGYRHIKVVKDTSRKRSNGLKKKYSLESLYNSKDVYLFNTLGSSNILKVTIDISNLTKFKKDLYEFIKYRTIWLDKTLYNYFNNSKIVD